MNKANILGRLTKDPELRYTQTGLANATFTLAVNRNFKNADGNYEADFIPVVVWRGLAEMLANNLKKGSRVCVSGRIQTRSYDDNNGNKRYVTEIVAEDATVIDWANDQNGADRETVPGFIEAPDDEDVPF